jgi:two-component system, OmpR family, alkaline phosphatase synthesis response regulator PhoP
MSRVLIIEDEAHLAQGLRFNLEAEGHWVKVDADGEAALQRLLRDKEEFDVIVLDVMLPGKDGFQVASELRKARFYVPILMLTARSRPEDVLKGFASGADDYLPKPFELTILLARLQGLLRRTEWMRNAHVAQNREAVPKPLAYPDPGAVTDNGVFSFDGKTINFGTLQLLANGSTVHLTLMEAELLRHLLRANGRVVSRKAILEDVWGLREDTDTRAIDNFIVRLRRYIEDDPAKPRHLLTVRGIGYRFVLEPERN